uniref:Uncharacterized protein n=2 Tax=Timema TaxID=61471 RepID=A0A7R9I3A2_9NEOP|nr:unnamed protein product [Timema bartmani]
MSCEWLSWHRDYGSERQMHFVWEEVSEHPLKPLVVTMTESRVTKRTLGGSTASSTGSSTPTPTLDPLGAALDGSDPLSQFVRQEMDPLSKMAADLSKDLIADDGIEPWALRKSAILSKFTTSEKLSIVTSFLSGGEKVVVKAQSSVVDKVKNRLEQLDDFEEGSVRQMLDLSQQEYAGRIEQLNQELVQAWHTDQRVRALKIAIQCSKLLVDTTVIQFYPSKFVLITDILDIFGKLVYERLRTKAEYYVQGSKVCTPLPENFTPDMVPESAKETCRNWFYKIASIRELVPRLYVEMAILKSYSFLTEFSQALLRLTRMIRGIGDPLVAVYARCYLCRVGVTVPSGDKEYVKENFYDFLASYNQQVFSAGIRSELGRQKVDLSTYLTLYTPALDWILQSVAANAPERLLVEILARCKEKNNSALLLNTIMAAFKPAYIASRALQFIELISACDEEGFPQYLLFRTLGLCLALADPPTDQRLQVLNDVWRVVTKLYDPAQYISCGEVWVQFAVRHFSNVNRLSVETRRIVKGHHTRKTAAFVRACAAYCYITIPSITSVFTRLELYLLSGQVALLNQCLGQADACFKAALSLIPELPKTVECDGKPRSSESYLVSYLCHFLSTLLVVPDSPEQGVLYLTRGLLNVLQHYTWEPTSNAKPVVYLHVLDLLSTVAQETYPYHIEKVDSNDSLYGSDPKFIMEINKMCSIIVAEILDHLQYLGKSEQLPKQGRTLEYLKKKSVQQGGNPYGELAAKLQLKRI